MNINGRLLLLVVAAALFIRVWSVNERPRHRIVARPVCAAQPVLSAQPVRPVEMPTAVVRTVVSRSAVSAIPQERVPLSDCPLPMPAGIVPGSYRVVSDDGQIFRLDVPPAESATGEAAAPDFQTTTVDGIRWYFIRLRQTEPWAVNTRQVPAIVEIDAGRTEAAKPACSRVIEQAERPRPPALPSPL